MLVNGVIFVLFFVAFVVMLWLADGYTTIGKNSFELTANKYFHNYLEMWWCLVIFLAGVLMVLYGVLKSALAAHYTKGIWWSGIGTVLVVLTLFWVAGYNNTPYYPSLLDPSSSLTIQNSSSSKFTLTVMSVVSLLIPFVVAYIAYVWYRMDNKSITPKELEHDDHAY